MNIKRTCQFLLGKEAGKPDAKLKYRIKWNSNKSIVDFNVGYRVDVNKWSKETQRCKLSTTHGKKKVQANIINREIQKFDGIAESVFLDFEKENHTPTIEEFRTAFNVANGKQPETKKEEKQFFDVFDEFVEKMGAENSWEEPTYTKFGALKKHLENFKSDISFSDLTDEDDSVLISFVQYQQTKEAMQLTLPKSETGMKNTTIAKNVGFLKWFLRWSSHKNYYQGKAHETFRPKLKGTDGNSKVVIFLTWEELMKVYNFDFTKAKKKVKDSDHEIDLDDENKKALERVRDVFCFCCFTSLRYSDVAKLRRSDVKETFISVVTKKTVDGLKIDLNDYSKSILDKYKDHVFHDDLALPVISNERMNDHLKIMGSVIGIDDPIRIVYFIGNNRYEEVYPKYELLTTHCGRRTFIVNALFLGIAAEVVMSWTGHSDYESMKPYVAIVDSLKEKSMSLFNRV